MLALAAARYEMRLAVDEGWEDLLRHDDALLQQPSVADSWALAAIQAAGARLFAHLGRAEEALSPLRALPGALERAPSWAGSYTALTCATAATMWLLGCTDQIDVVEHNVREKIVLSDFRWPMEEGRLSMARLCALQGRHDEATAWFAQARSVLDEQGARPLRAITDYDEALMYARRAGTDDRERAQPLLEAALVQFRAIGMPGWIRRTETLSNDLANQAPTGLQAPPASSPAAAVAATRAVFRQEGEFWTVAYSGTTVRLKPGRGMLYLSVLLRTPGSEIPATELVERAAQVTASTSANGAAADDLAALTVGGLGDAGEQLDAQARASYKQRRADLSEELDEAERFHDGGRADRLRTEIDFLTRELARAIGLGGRERRAGSHAERARVNVTRAIAAALKRISEPHPALGEHFSRTIRTGTFCIYGPDPRAPISWEL